MGWALVSQFGFLLLNQEQVSHRGTKITEKSLIGGISNSGIQHIQCGVSSPCLRVLRERMLLVKVGTRERYAFVGVCLRQTSALVLQRNLHLEYCRSADCSLSFANQIPLRALCERYAFVGVSLRETSGLALPRIYV